MSNSLENETLLVAGQDGVPEVFYTLEGEGEYVGYPSVFLRLAGCNLTCKGFASKDSPNGCDSYVSWSVKNKLTFKQIEDLFIREGFMQRIVSDGALLKITGGEPTIQWKQLAKLMSYLFSEQSISSDAVRIDFETNGTIIPGDELMNIIPRATFTVSPKLANNGDPLKLRFREDALNWHVRRGSGFKFVVQSEQDIEEIFKNYIDNPNVVPVVDRNWFRKHRVWFMPCCGSQAELLARGTQVAEWCKQYGVKFSNRMHLQLWDKATRV
jgi:7-carboxy-7-deazaguanine synthase